MSNEVKFPELQKAVRDINKCLGDALGTKQNHVAQRPVLEEYVVNSIRACLSEDGQSWVKDEANNLDRATLDVYEALTSQGPAEDATSSESAPEAAEVQTAAQAPGPEVNEPGEEGQGPKECPDFGKNYDPEDELCTKGGPDGAPCARAEECARLTEEGKKAKAKTKKKKEASPRGEGKPGVIGTIFQLLKSGPHSKAELLEKLKAQFPERNEASMKSTINVQVPNRMAKDKGVAINKNEAGQYFVA